MPHEAASLCLQRGSWTLSTSAPPAGGFLGAELSPSGTSNLQAGCFPRLPSPSWGHKWPAGGTPQAEALCCSEKHPWKWEGGEGRGRGA